MDTYPSCDHHGRLLIVRGDVDLATADTLLAQLRLLVGLEPGETALDLSRVSFMDSAGLRALIAFDRHIRTNGGRLRLAGASPPVTRLLDLYSMHGNPRDILDPPTPDAPWRSGTPLLSPTPAPDQGSGMDRV